MKLFVNLDTLQLITGTGTGKVIPGLEFKRGDGAPLQVLFLDQGLTPIKLPTGTAFTFIVKPLGDYEGTALVLNSAWTSPTAPTDFTYLCDPTFNTVPLNALFTSSTASVQAMGEITWQLGTGAPTTTKTFNVTIHNDLYKAAESTPANTIPPYPPPGAILTYSDVGVAIPALVHSHALSDLPSSLPPGYLSGGSVVQATSKSTPVTLNARCGQITLASTSIAANDVASFAFTNSTAGADDVVVVGVKSGAAASGSYLAGSDVVGGVRSIYLRNLTASPLSEAVVLQFAVVKGATV
jgi:hypothetical protein